MKYLIKCYSFKRCLLILFGLLVFAGGIKAQTLTDLLRPKKPFLFWNASLYSKNTKYVQININPQDFDFLKISDVNCEIRFYDYNGKSWTKTFRINNSQLKYNTLKSFWIKHYYNSVKSVEGVVARYDIQSFGTAFNTSLGDISELVSATYCRDYKYKGLNSPPGTVINSNKTFSPHKAYLWVEPDNPANLCTKLKPNIVRNPDGTFRPAWGYRWANSKDKDDFRVVPISQKSN